MSTFRSELREVYTPADKEFRWNPLESFMVNQWQNVVACAVITAIALVTVFGIIFVVRAMI